MIDRSKHSKFKYKAKDLTDECYNIQMMGFEACKGCSIRKTILCGGKDILKTGQNSKGVKVPISYWSSK
jgi:hypothetical protein